VRNKAFTLVEMVMVIVVLGVVAMIGTDIISHMYEGYIKSKVVNKLQARSEQVLDLIAKRLVYRVRDSVVASINGTPTTYLKLSNTAITANHNVLEWIGYDNEGMIGEWDGRRFSGWSGFVDLNSPSTTNSQFVTRGSRIDLTASDISILSNGSVNLSSSKSGAIIFKCSHNSSVASYGYLGGAHPNIFEVYRGAINNILIFTHTPSTVDYCEHYYLVWSAYALVPENVVNAMDASGHIILDKNGKNVKDFDLVLKYDYRPWKGNKYSSRSTKSSVLTKHVSTFRFIQVGETIRVKLCLRDPQTSYGFCKERAIW